MGDRDEEKEEGDSDLGLCSQNCADVLTPKSVRRCLSYSRAAEAAAEQDI